MLWHEHVRRTGKLLALGAAHYTGMLGWLRKRAMQNRALILMYHRVTPRGTGVPDYSPNGIAVTPDEFDMQMRFLREHYQVVPLSRIVTALRGGAFAPGMAAVTFDDGWRDVYQHAFPLLKQHRVPATIYLTTGFIDGKKWHWEERFKYLLALVHQACMRRENREEKRQEARRSLAPHSLDDLLATPPRLLPPLLSRFGREVRAWTPERRAELIERLEQLADRLAPDAPRPFMNWPEVREMSQHGIEIANHTVSHHALPDLSADEATTEIHGAAGRIREQLGRPPANFAYPYGKFNEQIRLGLAAQGVESATTTRLGLVRADSDPYALNRVNMCSDTCAFMPLFAGRILGF